MAHHSHIWTRRDKMKTKKERKTTNRAARSATDVSAWVESETVSTGLKYCHPEVNYMCVKQHCNYLD